MVPDIAPLIGFLAPYPEEVQQLTLEGRAFLRDLLAPVSELWFDATSAVCTGFGYSASVRDSFVNLAVYSDHATLIFSRGVDLDDPESRLKGDGKQVRNIRLTNGMATLKEPYVLSLIQQAASRAVRQSDFEPTVIVKVYEGPKRRPKPLGR